MRGHKDTITCVAFSANDEMIVTSSFEKSIIRWVASSGEQIGNPTLHNGAIGCFSISGDGTGIVSSSVAHGLCR